MSWARAPVAGNRSASATSMARRGERDITSLRGASCCTPWGLAAGHTWPPSNIGALAVHSPTHASFLKAVIARPSSAAHRVELKESGHLLEVPDSFNDF